ncbi:HNH endonuclease [Mycobacterium phage Bactobuster]|uniref:Uncharacterized protein n=1 Tax=Mycobacterium phage Bactobuster TaxID=1784956 RepID=A0A127KPP1_9CAUD|nr:HNH endonuclease [Mycobacterium phage Bactobuster]AMO44040.1 hypothetical protein SEA_BACTOBUSTER_72 [Mycobacterium phage Bactobuster]APC43225.1 hypothetical protein SEA_JAAN_78 [Mycobacterium phage Jaan]
MDPDVLLDKIRALIEKGEWMEATDLFEDLDDWLSRGGFLPADWRAA